MKIKWFESSKLSLCLLVISIVFQTPTISASASMMPPVSPVSLERGLDDSRELEAFFDGVIAAQIAAYHVPGVTVAVVKDGQLSFAKGYGYANVAKQIPVVADQTLFRIGSITKLMTWTAVMQLVEQGKLDLNADINTYLDDFKIPATFPQPITMANLLTHTSGFEDRGEGIFVLDPRTMIPLREYAFHYMPSRIRPPGAQMGYSNYGTGLAGYIVEVVSGMPFEQYVEKISLTRWE